MNLNTMVSNLQSYLQINYPRTQHLLKLAPIVLILFFLFAITQQQQTLTCTHKEPLQVNCTHTKISFGIVQEQKEIVDVQEARLGQETCRGRTCSHPIILITSSEIVSIWSQNKFTQERLITNINDYVLTQTTTPFSIHRDRSGFILFFMIACVMYPALAYKQELSTWFHRKVRNYLK